MNLEIIKNFLEENGFSINLDDDNKIIDIKDNLTNQLLQSTIGGYVSDDGSIRIYIDDSRVFIYKNGLLCNKLIFDNTIIDPALSNNIEIPINKSM